MDSLIFAVNAVAPIVLLVALGYGLKRLGWMNASFAKMANKLVFHVFLPCLLFLNVYQIQDFGDISFGFVGYAAVMELVVFLITLPIALAGAREKERRGALWQSMFRSNFALIGIPLATALFGAEGSMVAALLSAVAVPLLNVLAVICLSIFRGSKSKIDGKKIALDIVKNPLIQGVALGLAVLLIRLIFVRAGIRFRLSDIKPIYTAVSYLSQLATPVALLCLGAQFEFSAVRSLRREILVGTLVRTVLVPVIGIGTALLFFSDIFTGAHFAAFVAVFATPVSVSSVPMTQEMEGDVALAGQLVIWTTLVSGLTVFLISFLLKAMGIF